MIKIQGLLAVLTTTPRVVRATCHSQTITKIGIAVIPADHKLKQVFDFFATFLHICVELFADTSIRVVVSPVVSVSLAEDNDSEPRQRSCF